MGIYLEFIRQQPVLHQFVISPRRGKSFCKAHLHLHLYTSATPGMLPARMASFVNNSTNKSEMVRFGLMSAS